MPTHPPTLPLPSAYICACCCARVVLQEVPVTWNEIEGSKLDVLTATIQMARDITAIRFAYMLGFWSKQRDTHATALHATPATGKIFTPNPAAKPVAAAPAAPAAVTASSSVGSTTSPAAAAAVAVPEPLPVPEPVPAVTSPASSASAKGAAVRRRGAGARMEA